MESRFQNAELTNNPQNVHKCSYNKCSKVLNTFLFLFSSKITGIELTKYLSEQQAEKIPDQTASEEVSIVGVFRVCTVCLGLSGVQNFIIRAQM